VIYPRVSGVGFLESSGIRRIQICLRDIRPSCAHQVVQLARAGTRVAQLAVTFAVSEATVYNWLRQDRIDRGELDGLSTDQAVELAAAKRRIRQLETELAISRRVNEVFLEQHLPPKGSSR
jgi:transposase